MENSKVSIVPSYPAPSFAALEDAFRNLQDVAAEFQVDIVDGQFVAARSWPFTEEEPVHKLQQLAPWAKVFELEVDCMVMHPEQYLDQLVAVGAKRIIVHHGSTDAFSVILQHQQKHGYRLGYAFTNDVTLADIQPYVEECDFVQVMGIAVVGAQGQPFDERTINTIAELQVAYPTLPIAVDGSVNKDTVPRLVRAGVTRLCPGSAIVAASNHAAAYAELVTLANAR